MKRILQFVFNNSLLLILGAAAAMLWANIDFAGYRGMVAWPLWHSSHFGFLYDGVRVLDLHYLVNDVLMALFFAVAGREVWIAMLPGGDLHHIRRAAVPVLCAVGGMAGPAVVFILGAICLGREGQLGRGWAIPTATDIAFSYLVARMIFGRGHPAVTFLLLLAIADDALGMGVLAVFYPQEPVHAAWLLLSLVAVGVGIGFRALRIRRFPWYLLVPGTISWIGFALSGLHPALGLLPIVPIVPHVHPFRFRPGWNLVNPSDTDSFEYWLRNPVEVILGLFALCNAGLPLGGLDAGQLSVSLLVLAALLIGKPLGIVLTGLASVKLLGLRTTLSWAQMLVVSCAAGIGFTVAIFVATVAFAPGPVADAAKLGAVASFIAGAVAWAVAKAAGVGRQRSELATENTEIHRERKDKQTEMQTGGNPFVLLFTSVISVSSVAGCCPCGDPQRRRHV
jgi:NhaA family Na+:H+ antiporter